MALHTWARSGANATGQTVHQGSSAAQESATASGGGAIVGGKLPISRAELSPDVRQVQMDLVKQVSVLLDLSGQHGVLLDQRLDVVGVVRGVQSYLRRDRVGPLGGNEKRAAWTPAIIERNRFNKMYG